MGKPIINQKEESQIYEILDIIQRYAAEDYSLIAKMYGKNDLIDALAMGINIMGEELEANKKEREEKTRELIEANKAHEQEFNLMNILMENIPDHIYFKDLESKFLRISRSKAIRDGFKNPEELIGKTDQDIFSGQHSEKAFLDEQKIIKTGNPLLGVEEKVTWEDGRETWVLTSKMPFYDKNRKIIGTLGISSDITGRKLAEKTVQERMKELKCLHGISEIIESKKLTPDEVYQEIVNIIASGMQHPEITCGRIVLNKKSYKTDNFRKTKWMLQTDILVDSKTSGSVEVFYLEEMPDLFEGPFLKEERDLIDTIARQIGNYTARIKGEAVLKQSEEKLGIIFNSAPDAIYINDMKGTFIDGNKAAENMLGYGREELIGKSFIKLNILSKTQISLALKLLTKNTLGKSSGPDEFILNRKDGQKVIAEIQTHPVKLRGKTLVLGIARDITKRKKADAAFREREELLNSITSSAQEGIVVLDYDGLVIFWNGSAEKIFGYKAGEVMGKNFHDIIVPDEYQDAHKKGFSKFRKTGKGNAIGATLELAALNKNGQRFPVELSLSAITIDSQWHSVGIIRDITERKAIDIKLEKAKNDAENANKAKSEFLANMSHEIRTPMNAILGFAEILEEQLDDNPQNLDYVKGIRNSGKGLLGLINNILDLSKIEAGKLDINYEPINPYSIIEEIRQIFLMKTNEKKLDFNINVDPKLPGSLIFDETRLRQVLFNLIGNAVKFTSEGGITINVKSRDSNPEQSHVDLSIEVIDTGIGIPEKEQQIIFEPFRQKEGQSNRKYGGTGLGLTITARLIKIMGGTISIKSVPDQGSTFTVFLPGIQVAALSESTTGQDEKNMNISFQNPLVLLVEDIESNRKVINGYLSAYNIAIIEAEDGSVAIEKTRQYEPDLILMDMQMPVMDGYEAVKVIKSEKKFKNIPIVALTASSMQSEATKIIRLCDGYLRKPVSKSLLISELKKFLPYREEKVIIEASGGHNTDFFKELPQRLSLDKDITEEFTRVLNLEIIPEFNELLKNRSNKKIRKFAGLIAETGRTLNMEMMKAYGKELNAQVDAFNVQKIDSLLEEFKEMTDLVKMA